MKRVLALLLAAMMIFTLAACGQSAKPAEAPAATEAPAAEAPAAEAPAAEEEPAEPEASEQADVQYVLYLGTNDKDTNKPVFTQAEALERFHSRNAEEQMKACILRAAGMQKTAGGCTNG